MTVVCGFLENQIFSYCTSWSICDRAGSRSTSSHGCNGFGHPPPLRVARFVSRVSRVHIYLFPTLLGVLDSGCLLFLARSRPVPRTCFQLSGHLHAAALATALLHAQCGGHVRMRDFRECRAERNGLRFLQHGRRCRRAKIICPKCSMHLL